MIMFRKLAAFSAAALMILSFSLTGCCGGGSLCPLSHGGGCGAAAPVQAVAVDGCSSCAQQTYSQQSYAQPTYVQQGYSQPAFSQGGIVSGLSLIHI